MMPKKQAETPKAAPKGEVVVQPVAEDAPAVVVGLPDDAPRIGPFWERERQEAEAAKKAAGDAK